MICSFLGGGGGIWVYWDLEGFEWDLGGDLCGFLTCGGGRWVEFRWDLGGICPFFPTNLGGGEWISFEGGGWGSHLIEL